MIIDFKHLFLCTANDNLVFIIAMFLDVKLCQGFSIFAYQQRWSVLSLLWIMRGYLSPFFQTLTKASVFPVKWISRLSGKTIIFFMLLSFHINKIYQLGFKRLKIVEYYSKYYFMQSFVLAIYFKEKLLSEDLFHGGLVFYLKNDGLFGSTFCLEEWVVKLAVPLYFKKN